MNKVPNTGNLYAPSNWTWGVTRFLGIDAFGSPYVFLNKMWLGLALSSTFCLSVSLWYYVQNYSDSYIWALNCSLLACGPISMALSSVARVSNTLKDHILMSCLTGIALLVCAVVVVAANPILLGISLWCMLLFCIFQSRFHERGEIT